MPPTTLEETQQIEAMFPGASRFIASLNSESGRRGYGRVLRDFTRFAHGALTTFMEAEPEHVDEYLRSRNISEYAKRFDLQGLRSISKWYIQNRLTGKDPTRLAPPYQKPPNKCLHYTWPQVQSILATCNVKTLKGARDHALISVSYHLALPWEVATRLDVSDYIRDKTPKRLRVSSEAAPRIVEKELEESLERYLSIASRQSDTHGTLFLSTRRGDTHRLLNPLWKATRPTRILQPAARLANVPYLPWRAVANARKVLGFAFANMTPKTVAVFGRQRAFTAALYDLREPEPLSKAMRRMGVAESRNAG